ncbi:hypothetical protein L5515_004652 [Caenorhabditis briggsae]|uniref:Uncharacterized protein n=1 Tax=Caenorhabditis briggsae TaxID=6238 RepID=A0AAE9EI74_CAEBR|nr:hypothetical protein L5515_004652 [Caenorhabditis briggsae]
MEPSSKCKFPTKHEWAPAFVAVVAFVYGLKRVFDSARTVVSFSLHIFSNIFDHKNALVLKNAMVYESGKFHAFEATKTISWYHSIEETTDETELLVENSHKGSTLNEQGIQVAL